MRYSASCDQARRRYVRSRVPKMPSDWSSSCSRTNTAYTCWFRYSILAQFGGLIWPTQTTNGYSDSGEARTGGNSLDWRARVELFEEIRREYEFGVGTIVGVAKKLGVHRRMVREAARCRHRERGHS